MMRKWVILALLGLVGAAPALGDPYGQATFKYVGIGPAEMIRINDTRVGVGISNLNVYVGVSEVQVTSYSDNALNPVSVPGGGTQFDGTSVAGFCIDVDDSVSKGNIYPVHVTPLSESPDPAVGPMGTTKASQVAWLLDNNVWSLTMDAEDAAALQLAIWEVVNEENAPYDVDTGNFFTNASSNTSVQDAADLLLDDLTANWASGYSSARYLGLSSPVAGSIEKQDFVVKVVPVPGAALLGMLGLGAAGMRLRRWVG